MAPLLLTVSTKTSSYKNAGMMCDTCLEVSEQRHEEPGVVCLRTCNLFIGYRVFGNEMYACQRRYFHMRAKDNKLKYDNTS